MSGMTLARTNRARVGGKIACHDECDSCMSPLQIKPERRRVKRRERRDWKRDLTNREA